MRLRRRLRSAGHICHLSPTRCQLCHLWRRGADHLTDHGPSRRPSLNHVLATSRRSAGGRSWVGPSVRARGLLLHLPASRRQPCRSERPSVQVRCPVHDGRRPVVRAPFLPKPSSRRRSTRVPTGVAPSARCALISTGVVGPARRTQTILLFTSARGGEDRAHRRSCRERARTVADQPAQSRRRMPRPSR
jgi:hypothetical protein